MSDSNYFVYVITNPGKTVLYTGVTNDLFTRLQEHFMNRGKKQTFAGRYYCYNLIYFERFSEINHAIEREKEIKDLSRLEKERIINSVNPKWLTLKITDCY
jgi:putative endonuclease